MRWLEYMSEEIEGLIDPNAKQIASSILNVSLIVESQLKSFTLDSGSAVLDNLQNISETARSFVHAIEILPDLETDLEQAIEILTSLDAFYTEPLEGSPIPQEISFHMDAAVQEIVALREQLENLDEKTKAFWLGAPPISDADLLQLTIEGMLGKSSLEVHKKRYQHALRMVTWLEERVRTTEGELQEQYQKMLAAWKERVILFELPE